jgi:hypothetical protein
MITIQQLKKRNGLFAMNTAQFSAEVNTGYTALEIAKKICSETQAKPGVSEWYTPRNRDESSSDLVYCISDRD